VLKYCNGLCYSSVLTVQFAKWTVENKMQWMTMVQQTHSSDCPWGVAKSLI
jgi:hypothetical protein